MRPHDRQWVRRHRSRDTPRGADRCKRLVLWSRLAGAEAAGRRPSLPMYHTGTKNPEIFEAYVDQKNRVMWYWREGGKIVLLHNCNHDIVEGY